MKLINADYLTGRMFTEADLTNAHTCYLTIMAIIKSMESEDVLDKISTEIADIYCGQYCENPLTADAVRKGHWRLLTSTEVV